MKRYKVSSNIVPPVGEEMKVFKGEVRQKRLLEPPESEMKILEVTYREGGRTVWHVHEREQIIYVTNGRGFVEDSAEHLEVHVGDLVQIPKQTRHRHGSYADTEMTHLSFMNIGETTMEDD